MNEYMGWRVERNKEKHTVRLTQPVKIRRCEDEYPQDMVKGMGPNDTVLAPEE